MTELDSYIRCACTTLRDGDVAAVDSLAREIVSAFNSEIPNLSHYRGSKIIDGHDRHTADDLRKLIGKLRVLRDRKDQDFYGPYGLSTLTNHIHMLETAVEDGLKGERLKAVYDMVDSIYANYYDSYVDGLSGFNSIDCNPCLEQTERRIEKLKLFRDDELRNLRIAEARGSGVNLTQNAIASSTTSIQITLESVFENIEKLPKTVLSDDDKTFLKGMIGDLNADNKEKNIRTLGKLKDWLASKGTDVFIATIPYIAQFILS